MGLFASEGFSKDDQIISFKSRAMTKFEWRDRCTSLSIPEDAAFVFNGKMLYDPNFISEQVTPIWYYLITLATPIPS